MPASKKSVDKVDPTSTPTTGKKKRRRRSTSHGELKTPETKPSQRSVKSTTAKSRRPPSSASTPQLSSDVTDSKKKRRRGKTEPDPCNEANNTLPVKPAEKLPPTMDLQVHRLRHLEYIPSAVLAMAVGTSDDNDGYLAVAREDGSYELSVVSSYEDYNNKANPRITPISKIACVLQGKHVWARLPMEHYGLSTFPTPSYSAVLAVEEEVSLIWSRARMLAPCPAL